MVSLVSDRVAVGQPGGHAVSAPRELSQQIGNALAFLGR
jgi:hypothetical protein